MNRYILLHRLTGPAILVLLGVVALLHQAHVVSFSIFVPLLLILIGVIKLAERAVLANEPYPPPQGQYPPQYPNQPYPPYSNSGVQPYGGAIPPASPVAAPTHDFGNDPEGGKQ